MVNYDKAMISYIYGLCIQDRLYYYFIKENTIDINIIIKYHHNFYRLD